MKWFRKTSCQSAASQENEKVKQRHKRIKKTIKIPTIKCMQLEECCEAYMMTTSLCEVQVEPLQVLEPEDFFDDPVHVSNYREEAAFLELMSEWELIENPSMSENYFSADFEEEFLQIRTHQSSMSTATCHSSLSSLTYVSICSSSMACPKLEFKQILTEFFFADNIQLGIFVPNKRLRSCGLRKRHYNKNNMMQTQTDTSSKRLIKDYALERTQYETEAYARSIMGAIMKAPQCDTHEQHNCDHFDIKRLFHLDDVGNILLNMSHIEEISGYGFTFSQQNKQLYKQCLKHTQMATMADYNDDEENGCLKALRRVLQLVWNLVCGHPRNKVHIYGANGPGDSVRSYTLQLAQDASSTFARNIENFISCTKESREAAPQVVMRNMRQFMNGMKNYLVKHGEGKFQQEVEIARARLKSDEFLNLDAILETVMHKLVVLPLREHLYGMFVDYYTRTEDIQLLAQNVKYACGRCAADFGIRASVTPPSRYSLNMISNILLRLQEAELPLEKLDLFLSVITTIFEATGCPRGQQLGADDFLPILVYVVAKCGFVGAEIEAEFMWGLLQPTLLNGEPGYYLTALCSAVHVLKSFMASENESGSGSLDWRSSSLPACSSVLRVIIPDECNGSLQTRTLPVRPHTTTREVCRIIAHKARITNPQDYALFKLVDGEETLLSDLECPQDIRLAAKGKHCMLAYKRIDAKIAWPTAPQTN